MSGSYPRPHERPARDCEACRDGAPRCHVIHLGGHRGGVRRGRSTSPRRRTATAAVTRRPIGRTIRAYIALTKPRVLELLLVTTVPVMILAEGGLPSLWLVARHGHRRLDERRLRRRVQHVPRPRHRRAHAAHREPSARHRRGLAARRAHLRLDPGRRLHRLALGDDQLARGDAVGASRSSSTSSSTR